MLWNITVKNRSSSSQHKICVMYVLCSAVCGNIQMFFKGFRVQHDWSYCAITKLLTFSTTLVPVVFRLAVMLVFKMIYSMYGCTVEPLQTNKAVFVYFYGAVQMSSFLGLTVLCIGCTVVAVLSQTVAHIYSFSWIIFGFGEDLIMQAARTHLSSTIISGERCRFSRLGLTKAPLERHIVVV